MREKPIKDIRLFESPQAQAFGQPGPGHLGKLYPLADLRDAVALGARYAMKLAEQGFRTRAYDHVYVNLTPALAEEEAPVALTIRAQTAADSLTLQAARP